MGTAAMLRGRRSPLHGSHRVPEETLPIPSANNRFSWSLP